MNGPSDIDFSMAEPVAPPSPPEQSPLAGLVRAMRGRWLWAGAAALVLAPAFATLGYLSGVQLYDGSAILRVFPQESNILYRTADDSVLKTFDSFVKAETTTVASQPVMDRARQLLKANWPEQSEGMTSRDLAGSIEIKRNDSLITLNTKSRDAGFAAAKINAVTEAYLALQAESEAARTTVRLEELQTREAELLVRQADIRSRMLEVGGEYGIDALAKAHVEKVAQIDALSERRAEIEATLAALRTKEGESSADMSDQEIMRATLLDRALADLNFERAKREAELATLLLRYPPTNRMVMDVKEQIAVIDRAMADRREQIKVLGQTGALTDTSGANAEASQAEIAALLDKVTGQLATARAEARDLNGKRAELAALQEEAEEVRKLLDETRNALEVIRLEAGRALPGYTAVLSPATKALEPSEDSSKMLAAAGLGGGGLLPFVIALILGLSSGRVRYSDALTRYSHLVPVLRVTQRRNAGPREAARLRNAVQLHPLRAPQGSGQPRVITFTRLDTGTPTQPALDLAVSFARAGTKVLLVDADLEQAGLTGLFGHAGRPGWSEALLGLSPAPLGVEENLWLLPAGNDPNLTDTTIGPAAMRKALSAIATDKELVLICAPSPRDSLKTEPLLSLSDLGLAEVRASDRIAAVSAHVQQLDRLPRQGGGILFTEARVGDPGLMA